MLYAYDDEDNAPMIDFFEPEKNYVYKTMAELGFPDKPKPQTRGEVGDD